MGKVSVDMGETSCKVPSALDYIHKAQQTRFGRQEAQDGEVLNAFPALGKGFTNPCWHGLLIRSTFL